MKWERRTEIIGGVPFTTIEPVPDNTGPVNFDGGARQLRQHRRASSGNTTRTTGPGRRS